MNPPDLTSPIHSESDWAYAWDQFDRDQSRYDEFSPEHKKRLCQLTSSEFADIRALEKFSFSFDAYDAMATNPMAMFWLEGASSESFCKLMNDALWLSIKFELERMVNSNYEPQRVVAAYRAGWASMGGKPLLVHFLKDPPDKVNHTTCWKALSSLFDSSQGKKSDPMANMFMRIKFFKAFRDSLGEEMNDNHLQKFLASLLP